jgi:hypothetical protein
MSKEKRNKAAGWGGKRVGAGRRDKAEKTKICISVNEDNWQSALSLWKSEQSRKAKRSWLVDWLIQAYISGGVKPPAQMEAI